NSNYRSSSGDPNHARSVAEAFPPSTVAALPLVADEAGKLLVDATGAVMRGWNDVVGALARTPQRANTVARGRSSLYRPHTKAFPENTEIDVSMTYAATARPGGTVQAIVPDGRAFTLRQHLAFLRLPDDGFRPRPIDPRVGYFGVSFKDYARPIQEPLTVRW